MWVSSEVGEIIDQRYHVLAEALDEFVRQYALSLATLPTLTALDLELPNIVAVMDRLTVEGDIPTCLVSLFLNFSRYMNMRGLSARKRDWGTALLERVGTISNEDKANLLNNIGVACDELGEHEQAIEFYRQSMEARSTIEDDPVLAQTYSNLGVAYWEKGQLEEALRYAHLALNMERALGDGNMVAMSLMNIAGILYQQWKMEEALPLVREALKLVQETGDTYLQAQYTSQLAVHLVAALRFDEAVPVHEEGLRLLSQVHDEIGLARAKFNYGLLCNLLRDVERAKTLISESLLLMERYGMPEAQQAREWLGRLATASPVSDAPTTPPEEH